MRCLKEGLKEKYESWRMWENFLFLALDLGEFSESILAVERLLDLKWGESEARPLDVEAIRVLVDGVIRLTCELASEVDASEKPAFRILDRLEVLMKRMMERGTTQPELWACFSRLHRARGRYAEMVECLQSAYRSVQQTADGDRAATDATSFEKLGKAALALAEGTLVLRERQPETSLYAARSMLRNLMALTRDYFQDHALFDKLRSTLNTILSQEAAR
jgi:hypothetical protein